MAYPYYAYPPYWYPWMPFDPFAAVYYWMGLMYYFYMFRVWMDIWSKLAETIPSFFPPPKETS